MKVKKDFFNLSTLNNHWTGLMRNEGEKQDFFHLFSKTSIIPV